MSENEKITITDNNKRLIENYKSRGKTGIPPIITNEDKQIRIQNLRLYNNLLIAIAQASERIKSIKQTQEKEDLDETLTPEDKTTSTICIGYYSLTKLPVLLGSKLAGNNSKDLDQK